MFAMRLHTCSGRVVPADGLNGRETWFSEISANIIDVSLRHRYFYVNSYRKCSQSVLGNRKNNCKITAVVQKRTFSNRVIILLIRAGVSMSSSFSPWFNTYFVTNLYPCTFKYICQILFYFEFLMMAMFFFFFKRIFMAFKLFHRKILILFYFF